MKYILTVSEYIVYREGLNIVRIMTKYILEVRLFIYSQMISFLLLHMLMMKSFYHCCLAAFKESVCLHLGLALRPLSDPSAQY